jgi:hypothetical protein
MEGLQKLSSPKEAKPKYGGNFNRGGYCHKHSVWESPAAASYTEISFAVTLILCFFAPRMPKREWARNFAGCELASNLYLGVPNFSKPQSTYKWWATLTGSDFRDVVSPTARGELFIDHRFLSYSTVTNITDTQLTQCKNGL